MLIRYLFFVRPHAASVITVDLYCYSTIRVFLSSNYRWEREFIENKFAQDPTTGCWDSSLGSLTALHVLTHIIIGYFYIWETKVDEPLGCDKILTVKWFFLYCSESSLCKFPCTSRYPSTWPQKIGRNVPKSMWASKVQLNFLKHELLVIPVG